MDLKLSSPGIYIEKTKSVLFNIWMYVFFITAGYIVLYPFLYVLIGSFKGASDFYDPTVIWVPKYPTFNNIKAAIVATDYWNSLKNTLIFGIAPALLQFCSCALPAYGLARFKFKGKSLLLALMFLNMLVPVTMIIMPTYVNFKQVDIFGIFGLIAKLSGFDLRPDLLDTPLVFLLPALFGVGLKGGLFVYIYMQFFKGLPKELEEAAYIDGAGPIRAFVSIMVPSSGSSAIVVLIFSVIWNWCDYYLPQMYLTKDYPLPAVLNQVSNGLAAIMDNVVGKNTPATSEGVLISTCLLFLLPILAFYLLLQNKFNKSIATTGLVG